MIGQDRKDHRAISRAPVRQDQDELDGRRGQDRRQHHGRDENRAQTGQRDVSELLELGRSVDFRRLIELFRNGLQAGKKANREEE